MNRRNFLANALLTVVLGTVTVALLVLVNRLAAPQPRFLPTPGAEAPDYAAVARAVTAATLRARLESIAACGARFPGAPGAEQAAAAAAAELRALGYTVVEQPFPVTVPVTRHARLLDAAGQEIPGVSIHPFLPNEFRTCTTPPEGLTGTVYEGKLGLAREFQDVNITGNFALLPLGIPWTTVAGMGVKAVLYYDPGDHPVSAAWAHTVDASMDIPRFLLRGDPARVAGQTVTVQARVDFETRVLRNVVGILPGPEDSGEAVLFGGYADAVSYVPDVTPGASQACSLAVVLETARQLAADRPYLRRTAVVVITSGHTLALAGMREFLDPLGLRADRDRAGRDAAEEATAAAAALALAEDARRVCRDPAYWGVRDAAGEEQYWATRPKAVRRFVGEVVMRVFDQDHMAALERLTQARIDWIRAGMPVPVPGAPDATVPIFDTFNRARDAEQLARAQMTTPLPRLRETDVTRERFAGEALRQRVAAEMDTRHAEAALRDQRARARSELNRLLQPCRRILFLGFDLTAASGRLALVCGENEFAAMAMPADTEIAVQYLQAGQGLSRAVTLPPGQGDFGKTATAADRFVNLLRAKDALNLGFVGGWFGAPLYFDSSVLFAAGHTALTVATLDDGRPRVGTPGDDFRLILDPDPETLKVEPGQLPPPTPLENLECAARLTVAAALRLARGFGQIVPVTRKENFYTVRGRAVSQVGDNPTPNQLMPGALVSLDRMDWMRAYQPPGVLQRFLRAADWSAAVEFRNLWTQAVSDRWTRKTDMSAAVVEPETGAVTWVLSTPKSGPLAPYAVRGVPLPQYASTVATAVLFRAAPVQVFPMPDPNTMRGYAAFGFLEAGTQAEPKEYAVASAGGGHVCFVPPETRLFFTFKKGSKATPNLHEIRAFALNVEGAADKPDVPPKGLTGVGYLAADTPSLINIELDVARSMAQLNTARTRLQERYGMADRMVRGYSGRSVDLAEEAAGEVGAGRWVQAKRRAAEAIAYASNIHPVIRKNASDAIVGILFFLLLALPFAVFMEKLLVGHPDLRFQILYQGIIFLLFFLALRAFHPAYQLVRSSFMILLGFITFSLAAFVTAFVAMRFATNVGAILRRFRQEVETADVSRAGAAATAFLLGLNNLRKRPVRTALTMATLVLVTFVMICFSSVSSNVVDIEFPVGKSSYSGLLVRDRFLRDVGAAVAPLREVYGEQYLVAPRAWAGNFIRNRSQAAELAEYPVSHAVGEKSFGATAHAILGVTPQEREITALADACDVLVRWFESETEESCLLPRSMADQIRLDDEQVRAGTAVVTMGGKRYTVLGILNEAKVDGLLDLDGEGLMPIDILSLRTPAMMTREAEAVAQADESQIPEDVPRLPAAKVVITPLRAMPAGTERTASVAVRFAGLDYAAARSLISAHLERSGEPTYYGLDGVAFYGGKFRMRSVEGILDILLPIVIAALTVLNTMRGSVYERRSELYVFNAVGLAPNHIRFLFLAEAAVYAVVGVVGGYLLAQGFGTLLQHSGLTAGLTINYSSLSAVFVSFIIMVVVFASSLIPARMAARLAAPAESMTRKRETSSGDVMELELPFTFNRRDRVGIVPYFVDWFENFGEGSAGDFFCAPPRCSARLEDNGHASPCVETTTWLKPYDLGVSQQVRLVVRHDPATGDNVATVYMTRKSGDTKSWERCCHRFIGRLRKRLLTWRAVSEADRQLLLERGRQLLDPRRKDPIP